MSFARFAHVLTLLAAVCSRGTVYQTSGTSFIQSPRRLHRIRQSVASRSAHRTHRITSQADLFDGFDETRNAQVAELKRLFYNSRDGGDQSEGLESDTTLGVIRDLPLCRWGNTILPGHQACLNIFEPTYTHMFEGVLSGPAPWHYVQLQLEGGTRNLDNPDYQLKRGSKSPLVGTLIRIVMANRLPDSTLVLVVQGLVRVHVLTSTSTAPFHRANVQFLPDKEQLEVLVPPDGPVAAAPAARARAWASFVGEEWAWHRYEVGNVSHSQIPALDAAFRGDHGVSQLAPFNDSVSAPELASEASREAESNAAELTAALAGLSESRQAQLVPSLEMLKEQGVLKKSPLPKHWTWDPEAGVWSAGTQDPLVLEREVWQELATMIQLRNKAQGRDELPVPLEMLGLLPPSLDASGWPQELALAAQMEQLLGAGQSGCSGQEGGVYVRVGPEYPAHRRAQKLSYMVATVLGKGCPQQILLELDSTAERLNLVLDNLKRANLQFKKRHNLWLDNR